MISPEVHHLVMICAHCDIQPATHFTTFDSPHDPCCDACYAEHWTTCPHCDREVPTDDMGEYQTCHASMGGPAEYEPRCASCMPNDDRDEDARADRAYDEWCER